MLGNVYFMDLIVIHEQDLQDKEQDVIGVCSSIENAEKLIKEYYGEFIEISKQDIRDSTLEYSKILEIKGIDEETYRVKITLQWFSLNVA